MFLSDLIFDLSRVESSLGRAPVYVDLLHRVETGQNTSAGGSTKNIGACSLEEGRDSLVLEDLHSGVHWALVMHSGTRRHHHSSTNRVDGVGGERGEHSDCVSECEGDQESGILGEEDWLERIVQTEVETSVDEDADGRNDEASVKTGNAVGRDRLSVHVDQAFVLTFTALAFGVVGELGTGEIERVDDAQW